MIICKKRRRRSRAFHARQNKNMKAKNSFKKYGLRKTTFCLIASLSFLAMLDSCGLANNKTTASGTASQTDISRKSNKPDRSPVPEEDTDIHPKSKKHGKISLSKDKKTIFVQGWLETYELTNRRTEKATKIVFRKDAGIILDHEIESFYYSPLKDAPLVKEIEVEEGNPYLYEKNGMLIQRTGADFDDFEYTTDRETLILCVPVKKGEVRIPEGVQTIYTSAFRGCSDITSVFLPSSLFGVDPAAFGDMESCKNIHPPKNSKEYISINGVLYHCSNSNSSLVAYPAGKTDKIFNHAPKNTDFIYSGAFLGATHLQEVYLPSGIKTIGEGAFMNCKNLRKVIVKNKKRIPDLFGTAFEGCPKLKERVKDQDER